MESYEQVDEERAQFFGTPYEGIHFDYQVVKEEYDEV